MFHKYFTLILIWISIYSLSCFATEKTQLELKQHNSYLDQKYLFKLWSKINNEQLEIIKRAKRSSVLDQDLSNYWVDLGQSEREVSLALDSHVQEQGGAVDSKVSLNKIERTNEPSLEKATKFKFNNIVEDLEAKARALEENEKKLNEMFAISKVQYGGEAGELLVRREGRLNQEHPALRGKVLRYNKAEKLVFMEHFETYSSIKEVFIINCLRDSKKHSRCIRDFEKYQAYLSENVLGSLQEKDIATIQLKRRKNISTGTNQNTAKNPAPEENLGKFPENLPAKQPAKQLARPTLKPYESKKLEVEKGDRFFLSTDLKCVGEEVRESIGYIYEPSIIKYLKEESSLKVGRDLIPLYNCIKGRGILTTIQPLTECQPKREHIIGYVPSMFLVNKKHAQNMGGTNTILRFLNISTSQRTYIQSAEEESRKEFIGRIKGSGFNIEEGPLFVTYKSYSSNMKELVRCRFKRRQ